MNENYLSLSLPIYDNFRRGNGESKFLLADELVDQTSDFMEKLHVYGFGESLGTIFFLDKSARPLAYMVRKLATVYYPGVSYPSYCYINIGRKKDLNTDYPYSGDELTIRKFFTHFTKPGSILIVDEFSHTGNSLNYAQDLIGKAFPERNVYATIVYKGMPNWYGNPFYLGVEETDSYRPSTQRASQNMHQTVDNSSGFKGTRSNLFIQSRRELDMVIKEIEKRRSAVMV